MRGIESSAVDGVAGVVFHEFHGGVLSCLFVPVAVVDEGWLGWERHAAGNEMGLWQIQYVLN